MNTEPSRPPNRRYLKATLAGGAGGLLAVLVVLLEQRPELAELLLERVLIAWGPQFVIVLLLFAFLYLLADRYAPRLIAAQRDTALALQNLAGAVQQMVARDDAFQREQDVLLNHVARRVEALFKLLESHLSRLPRANARGAKPALSAAEGSRGHRTLNGHLARLSRREARGLSRRSEAQTPSSSRGARVKTNARRLSRRSPVQPPSSSRAAARTEPKDARARAQTHTAPSPPVPGPVFSS